MLVAPVAASLTSSGKTRLNWTAWVKTRARGKT